MSDFTKAATAPGVESKGRERSQAVPLRTLYEEHVGKISDTWALYVDEIDKIFAPFRDEQIIILEIGVQNGGSLEIWGKYFPKAHKIVGVDIDAKCAELNFADPRISVIVGDATSEEVKSKVLQQASAFDLIIDDGSHKSSDIVRAFGRYFPALNEGGLYVVEDLHASYWTDYEGGLHNPLSAMAFFRRLTDITNYEHWRNGLAREHLLKEFSAKYEVGFDNLQLARIHSVAFTNSLCIIEKAAPDKNMLGKRVIAGNEESVSPGSKTLNRTSLHDYPANTEDDAKRDVFEVIKTNHELKKQLADHEQATQHLLVQLSERDEQIGRLEQTVIVRDGEVATLNQTIAERDREIAVLAAAIEEKEGHIARLEELASEKERRVMSLNQALAEREAQLTALNQGLAERDGRITALYNFRSWRFTKPLRAIGTKIRLQITQAASIKTIGGYIRGNGLKAGYHLLRGHRLLLRSGIFDTNYYLSQNPDVGAARIDPALHFMIYGVREGRNPNAFFDTTWYLRQNPDVAEAGLNPLVHYLQSGADEGRDPSPRFSSSAYLAANPDVAAAAMNPLLHYLKFGRAEGRMLQTGSKTIADASSRSFDRNDFKEKTNRVSGSCLSSQDLLQQRFQHTRPLSVFTIPTLNERRINIVTDSVNKGSLFGGVATGIILATHLAEMSQARLRIITQTEPALPTNIDHILKLSGMSLSREIEFLFAPITNDNVGVDFHDLDYFLTTSWWTTQSTMASVRSERILYLLQEDERMFYPYGDDRLRCEQTMRNQDIRFAVNTRLLFEHLLADGFDNLRGRGTSFEPAFPKDVFYPERMHSSGKHKFFFYARPNNLRNLFYLGVEVINEAILRGVIDLNKWDVVFVGKDIPTLRIGDNYVPLILENLSWADYAALVRSVDLGLCLMYSPHPSYPPFDLTASGAVVVTNRYGQKQDLSAYSRNLILADLDCDSLVKGIEAGVRLALDPSIRGANFRDSSFCRDWRSAFSNVVNHHIEEVL